ncbi:MAG: prolyl oligopeptidase family serine peptidase, partial [bacterium]|nr:prolyl oligopeptidase family serine peptidase [bacterium]
ILIIMFLYCSVAGLVYHFLSKVPGGFGNYADNRPDSITKYPNAYSDFDSDLYKSNQYQAIVISSSNNLKLRGWLFPGQSKQSIVIAAAGHKGSCRNPQVLIPAIMLQNQGLSVALIDFRDQGESDYEDGRTALGSNEYQDFISAVHWAKKQGYQHVGLYGCSMAATSALLAASYEPMIDAVWAEAPFAHRKIIVQSELPKYNIPSFMAAPVLTVGRLISGDPLLSHNPINHMQQLKNTKVMLVHSKQDKRISIDHTYHLLEEGLSHNVPISAWILNNSGHCEAVLYNHSQYKNRLINFFDGNLIELNNSPN